MTAMDIANQDTTLLADQIIDPPARTDARSSKAWLRALALTGPISNNPSRVFPTVIEELAERFGDAPALLSDGETLSFRALDERANRYARWALAHGLRRGDTVCLLMPNRPEYMAIWLGIARAGGVAALVNTNLAGPSLAHCIDVVTPRHVIVAQELVGSFDNARRYLASDSTTFGEGCVKTWLHGAGAYPDICDDVARLPGGPLSEHERPAVTIDDRALYVYTSGTTGMPKAAAVTHYRLMVWTHWFAGMMGTTPGDRMYNCLPMYHSIGGAVATGAVLVNGGSVAIREKFSASGFWDDIARFECTLFQYIGELCRYLLQAPAHVQENRHPLRMCCGNGLRADVWMEFKRRFRIPQILEFYAATEGNVSLFNVEGKPGAIGRLPPFIAHRAPVALVRFDVDAAAPQRNEQGFCIRCAPNETGEAIGRISDDPADRSNRFDGYTSREATEQKILRDVFVRGDAWYRTGDLMRRDDAGFYYFVDRIGDTFRWKGENVATSEVAAVLTAYAGIVEANVYGVAVAGADGRAGMAEVVCTAQFDPVALREHLAQRLPKYAHPVFLRLRRVIAVTPTFKQLKGSAADHGYDPATCSDPLYVLDPERRTYVTLDAAFYARIAAGVVRF